MLKDESIIENTDNTSPLYISTSEAAVFLNCTAPSTKHLLKTPDKRCNVKGTIKHYYLKKRVIALVKKRAKLVKEGKLRVPANRKVHISVPLTADAETLKRALEDPYGTMVVPTFKGSICRACKKVPVATGQWLCSECRAIENHVDRGPLHDEWVYA